MARFEADEIAAAACAAVFIGAKRNFEVRYQAGIEVFARPGFKVAA
jgi:hypothetical protein